MGSAFPSARDRASGDLLTGDISTLQQTYTRTCGHNGHYTRLLCVVTGHNVTLTCHGYTVTCHDGGVTIPGTYQEGEGHQALSSHDFRVTQGDVNKSSSATRLSQRGSEWLLHKTMNSVGESDQQGRENQGSCNRDPIGLRSLSHVIIGVTSVWYASLCQVTLS